MRFIALCSALLLSMTAVAHHAFPEDFNTSRTVELEGSIISLSWTNPHTAFSLLADDGSIWQVESNAIAQLVDAGISQSALAAGTSLKVAGFPARDGSASLYTSNILLPGRQEIVLRPGAQRRWNGSKR